MGGADRLFATDDPAIRERWERVLSLQTELLFPHELAALTALPAWQRARTVVDVGTGNGDWLARLAAAHPGRSYVGLDPSPELIAAARRHEGPGLRFRVADWRAADEGADLLILRMVLQHLADHDVLVHALAGRLAPGGALLVVDNDPTAARTWPETPRTTGAFAAIARQRRRALGVRDDHVTRFVRAVGACRDLAIVADRVVVVRAIEPAVAARFGAHTRAVLELFRETGEVPVDFAAAIEEWDEWCEEPGAYAQLGLRLLVAERR